VTAGVPNQKKKSSSAASTINKLKAKVQTKAKSDSETESSVESEVDSEVDSEVSVGVNPIPGTCALAGKSIECGWGHAGWGGAAWAYEIRWIDTPNANGGTQCVGTETRCFNGLMNQPNKALRDLCSNNLVAEWGTPCTEGTTNDGVNLAKSPQVHKNEKNGNANNNNNNGNNNNGNNNANNNNNANANANQNQIPPPPPVGWVGVWPPPPPQNNGKK
jgi:hypothetical protein